MKISDLTDRLEEIKKICGDIQVYIVRDVCGEDMNHRINDIFIHSEYNEKVVGLESGNSVLMTKLIKARKKEQEEKIGE